MKKILLVTNFPAPYRVHLYDELGVQLGEKFFVIYTDSSVEGHEWHRPHIKHSHHFIRSHESAVEIASKFHPDVVILGGVNKHILKLFFFAKQEKIKISIFTDMWQLPFSKLSKPSQYLRKYLYRHADHFIVPGLKSKVHITESTKTSNTSVIHVLPILPDACHFPFKSDSEVVKEFDLVFSGQIIPRKLPLFFVEVAAIVNRIKKLKVLVLGNGPLREMMKQKLDVYGIQHTFAGYVKQKHLQSCYSKSRLLLFPTENDPWGVVANEALSAGVPVIISPNAGAADDLIISGKSGFVLENDVELWAQKAIEILEGKYKFEFDAPPTIKAVTEDLLSSLNSVGG
ncbi:MAG: glycosyltransferase family 4 protein [Ignavibacteria bacterium]|nr:glycosyltransferase family 4 protein [Ignavibacteria bacterium]